MKRKLAAILLPYLIDIFTLTKFSPWKSIIIDKLIIISEQNNE